MNLAKQFREFGVQNSINPMPPDAQVFWYNLMQCFNADRWRQRKLVVRTQTLENQCGMTRKRLSVARNTLIQRGLIKYYPSRQASGSPTYELTVLYENEDSVFPVETQKRTHTGTQVETQNGTHREHLNKTILNQTELFIVTGAEKKLLNQIVDAFSSDPGLKESWTFKGMPSAEFDDGVKIWFQQNHTKEYSNFIEARKHFLFWMPNYLKNKHTANGTKTHNGNFTKGADKKAGDSDYATGF